MVSQFRKLNEAGTREFTDYINSGAIGEPPRHLLKDKNTSSPLSKNISPGRGVFGDRYQFGAYLVKLLDPFDAREISGDAGLWNAFALLWFDQLCPPNEQGRRDPKREYRYVLSPDYRHYYRHLVRSPWQLVKEHGAASQFLLISPKKPQNPLSTPGEIFEQFGGRQQVFGSKAIISAANRLYFDNHAFRPKTGVAGRGRGSAHRFGLVLRQLALTYDTDCMTEDSLISILPREFDKWKKQGATREE